MLRFIKNRGVWLLLHFRIWIASKLDLVKQKIDCNCKHLTLFFNFSFLLFICVVNTCRLCGCVSTVVERDTKTYETQTWRATIKLNVSFLLFGRFFGASLSVETRFFVQWNRLILMHYILYFSIIFGRFLDSKSLFKSPRRHFENLRYHKSCIAMFKWVIN